MTVFSRTSYAPLTLAECLSSLFDLSVQLVPTDATSWLLSDVSSDLVREIDPKSAHACMVRVGVSERQACVVKDRFGFPMAIYALGSYGLCWQLFYIQ